MDSLRVSIYLFAAKGIKKRTYVDFKSDIPIAIDTLLEGVINVAYS